MRLIAALLAAAFALVPASTGTVSVVYAGSLVRAMEGPVATALRQKTGLEFSGEAKGSKALAHLIAAGLRTPDVFISADPRLLNGLSRSYAIFGSARMVIAYSANSPHANLFRDAAKGSRSILSVLANPAVRTGRTDPQLDPKGARTVTVLRLLGEHFHAARTAAEVLERSPVFPEEDLAVRVESGDLDAGFFYSTEIPGRGLIAVELPAGTNLANDITYAIAKMDNAPNPRAADTFVNFMLYGAGRDELQRAGLRYFAHPRIVRRP